jgi:hypothetical protein
MPRGFTAFLLFRNSTSHIPRERRGLVGCPVASKRVESFRLLVFVEGEPRSQFTGPRHRLRIIVFALGLHF